tara:strand:- start:6810 stop:8753 length:1944 start_codon:yes stop_codon:yes gene_type:complete
MCGFCGFFLADHNQGNLSENLNTLSNMSKKIEHRGPDGHGQWFSNDKGIFLDHRRLSIIDLSSSATQPMSSQDGRWKIVFNGEIYNFLELKDKLSKEKKLSSNYWKGSGDTEVLINLIDFYGIDKTLNLIEGMFAFVVWDNLENKIILARDRLGEKPLYYLSGNNSFIFASDISAIQEFYKDRLSLDINSIRELSKYNYIPSPNTIYKNVKKIEPGSYMIVNSNLKNSFIKKYWGSENFLKKNQKVNTTTIPDEVETILLKILEKETISDVPVGIYLSGGVDSTLLATLLSLRTETKLKSFTIRNRDNNFDESLIAKKNANFLNLEHHEFEVSKNDLLDIIDQLSDVYTEPFADSSQLPSLLLNYKAKNYIKVAIGGDGGDELFGGYNRYYLLNKYYYILNKIPLGLKTKLSNMLLGLNVQTINSFCDILSRISFGHVDYKNFGYKIQKSAFSIVQKSDLDLYDNLLSACPDIDNSFVNNNFDQSRKQIKFVRKENFLESMMLTDIKYYLPDDILCKVDRASMWHGIEVRAPFLHHSLVEYCLGLPVSSKFKKNENKWILRSIIKKYIPNYNNNLKMGFSSPIDNWLRHEIKEIFESCLDKNFIKNQGIFNFEYVSNKWLEHLNGKRNWGKFLWSYLIFQKWFKKHC